MPVLDIDSVDINIKQHCVLYKWCIWTKVINNLFEKTFLLYFPHSTFEPDLLKSWQKTFAMFLCSRHSNIGDGHYVLPLPGRM